MKKLNEIKHKLIVTTLTVCMSHSFVALAGITGNNSVEFETDITVESTAVCSLTVTPPQNTRFTATYEYGTAAAPVTTYPDGVLNNTTIVSSPAYISVSATGGTPCSINTIKVNANMGAGQEPYGLGAMATFGTGGGVWTYTPILTDARFYTDDAYITPSVGKITANTPSAIRPIAPTLQANAGSMIGNAMNLTDTYVQGAGLYGKNSGSGQTFFTSSQPSEIYQSAQIGVGALVLRFPVALANPTIAAPLTAVNGDVAKIPFTITISEM